MPFFVAVDQEFSPQALDRTLTTIEADFASSRAFHPGRRHTRVFQHLNQSGRLLTIGEWEQQADYERLRQSSHYRELVVCADPPATIQPLTRLRYFARMSTNASVVACVQMSAPPHAADDLRAYVLRETPGQIVRAPGLLTHEVYQVGTSPGELLVVHGRRTLNDLQRFLEEDTGAYNLVFAELGVVLTRFAGAIAAQFSRLDDRPGAGLSRQTRPTITSPTAGLVSSTR
jgi:quinol monooxygenase YgiN